MINREEQEFTNLQLLKQSIALNNVEKTRETLLKNPAISDCVSETFSPLWEAMLIGSKEIVELLLKEFGVNPDEKCPYPNEEFNNSTFLQYIARSSYRTDEKDYRVAEVLIQYGAEIEQPCHNLNNFFIKNLFQNFLYKGDLKFLELMLENGKQLEGPEWSGLSPALYALDVFLDDFYDNFPCSYKKILKLFIKYGLNIDFCNDVGKNLLITILSRIHCENFVEIAEILLDSGVLLIQNGFSPLYVAINRRHIELASLFIERGVDVNVKCKFYQELPLFLAVFYAQTEFLDLLVLSGADVNSRDFKGDTVLHKACYRRHAQTINFFLDNGADINVKNNMGLTPFYLLASTDNSLTSYFFFTEEEKTCCITMMIKEIAKLMYFKNSSIFEMDLSLLQGNEKYRQDFDNYKNELFQMSRTKFYSSYSYSSVLKLFKNIKKLAKLARNQEFVSNFLKNSNQFPYYSDDLHRGLNQAFAIRDETLIVESRLSSVFGDLLPDIVISKLTENLSPKDLPVPE